MDLPAWSHGSSTQTKENEKDASSKGRVYCLSLHPCATHFSYCFTTGSNTQAFHLIIARKYLITEEREGVREHSLSSSSLDLRM